MTDVYKRQAPCRSQLHQPVVAVPGGQREGRPYEDGRRCRAEADTYPLVDADHVEDEDVYKRQVAEGDGSQFLHREVVVTHHPLEAGHIGVGDVTHHQDGLLYLPGCLLYTSRCV